MHTTLATLLQEAIGACPEENAKLLLLLPYIHAYPAQVVILTSQLMWSQNCVRAFTNRDSSSSSSSRPRRT